MQAEQRQKITGYFIEEAKEHLETIEQGLADFQATLDNPESASEVYRAAHSIKGGAAMLELESIRTTAHRLEDYFKRLKESPVQVDATLSSLLKEILKGLRVLVGELERTFTVPDSLSHRIMGAIEPVFKQVQARIDSLFKRQVASTAGNISASNSAGSPSVELFDPFAPKDTNFERPSTSSAKRSYSTTPEVGEAELSTLADLFAASDLDENLHDEHGTIIHFGPARTSERDEFDDLLEQLDESEQRLPSTSAPEQDLDISGFLDQLSVTSLEAIPSAPSPPRPIGDARDRSFDFLGDLANSTSASDAIVDSSLDDLFADDSRPESEPLEEIAPPEPSTPPSQPAGAEFDLDTLLADLETSTPSLEISAPLISYSDSDRDRSAPLYDPLDADFSLDTLFEGEGGLDLSAEPREPSEGSDFSAVAELPEQEELDFSAFDTLLQGQEGVDFSLDTLFEGEGGLDFSAEPMMPPREDLELQAAPARQEEEDVGLALDTLFEGEGGLDFSVAPMMPPREDLELQAAPARQEEEDVGLALDTLFESEGGLDFSVEPMMPPREDLELQAAPARQEEEDVGLALDTLFESEGGLDFSVEPMMPPQEDLELQAAPARQEQEGLDFSLDTILQEQEGVDFSLDTILQEQEGVDFSLDTILQEQEGVDFSLDTIFQEQDSPPSTPVRNLRPENAADSLETLFQNEEAGDFSLDALLQDLEEPRASEPGATAGETAEAIARVDEPLAPRDRETEANVLGDLLASAQAEIPVETAQRDPLFAAPQATAPAIADPAKNEQTPESGSNEVESSLFYYAAIADLESSIETVPPSREEDALLFARLESLLAQSSPPIQSGSHPLEPSELSASTAPRGEEDEFSDLIKLLDFDIPGTGQPTNIDRPRPRRASTVVEQTLKVPVKQMDNLNNLMGELVVNRNSLEGDGDKLRQSLDSLMHQVQNLSDVAGRMQDLYERSLLEDALLKSRQEYRGHNPIERSAVYTSKPTNEAKDGYSALEMDSFSRFHELAQETIELIVRVRESASDINLWVDDIDHVARSLRQVTSQLQEGLTKARMVPFSRTADRLPLAVKKICPQLQKEAQLHLEGKETLIDKMILEHLSDPLTHLVNNALTHGIESPEERIALGKRPGGQITVRALQQGNQTVISVSDDGAGIDPERVKTKALEKRLISPTEAPRMSELDVYELLFHAGFSTKDRADNFAGRGVGLDVVRTSIAEIRGNVSIESELGCGTTFTIRLPLTLSISKALCCTSANAPMAFPMDGVEDMFDLPLAQVQSTEEGYQYIQWRDIRLHYCHLSELLTYHRKIGRSNLYVSGREDNMVSIVVLRSATSFLAIGVDQVVGEQEIVIKQIVGPVPKPAGIAGATVQGDGRIMAIADVLELIQIAEGRMRKESNSLWQDSAAAAPSIALEQSQPMVLIVDDSITVRSLLSMTFEKAGYQVEQARDGQDAWEKLRGGLPCDIVFCDIEMPRLDGLELLGRLQKDEQLKLMPVAMLTSRGAERHRRVAAELGASGYFTKPYLEEVLLDAAERMMEGEVLLAGSSRKPGQKRFDESQARSAAVIPPQAPPILQARPKVLIVDDSVTVRSLLAMTFEGAGYEVSQARDGEDAWNQLRGGLKPDVAFFDIEMPRLDGIQLLERLQGDETLKEIPVAMITSRGAQKMRQRAAERGASGYFTKPYVEKDLLDAAQRLRDGEVLLPGSSRVSQVATPHEPEPEPAPAVAPVFGGQPIQPSVMIVDDSITVRSLLETTFGGAGYQVFQARDGQDALNQLQAGLKVSVIFLDIEMPRMDGITLLSHLQADENLKGIPVAMLTSRGAKKMKQRAAAEGAKGYFVKPYVDEILLDAARRLSGGEVLLAVESER